MLRGTKNQLRSVESVVASTLRVVTRILATLSSSGAATVTPTGRTKNEIVAPSVGRTISAASRARTLEWTVTISLTLERPTTPK
jgi:hypothetical protein